MTEDRRVSIVGLGLLGGAIGRRLLEHGWTVRGYDLDSSVVERFRSTGGHGCETLEDCLEGCRRIVLSLPESDTARVVLKQILEFFSNCPGSSDLIILDTTTGDPLVMEQNSELAQKQGIGYLDACVGGSSQEAERGEAIVMVGGEAHRIESCQPLLEILSSQLFRFDRPGDGARMKLVTNLVLGLTRAALAEGLAFADGLGLDAQTTLEILESGPARSHVMQTKGRKMIERDFEPQARLAQHLKDVRLILKTSACIGRSAPLTAAHEKILRLCTQEGWGDLDNSSVLLGYFSEKIGKLE